LLILFPMDFLIELVFEQILERLILQHSRKCKHDLGLHLKHFLLYQIQVVKKHTLSTNILMLKEGRPIPYFCQNLLVLYRFA